MLTRAYTWLTALFLIVSVNGAGLAVAAISDEGQQTGAPAETIRGKDGAPMIRIPAGAFLMGSNDGLPNEKPEHHVTLDAYYIDQFEITASRYQKFVESASRNLPPMWDDGADQSLKELPAVGMSWTDAARYCKWAGRRLPSEAEWEKAARGTDGRRYPWGHMQPFVDIANYNRGVWVSDAVTLVPVGSGLEGMSVRFGLKSGGRSPYGLSHMAGNAAEWVGDWYDREYYPRSPEKNPTGPPTGEKRVLRGGSWADLPIALRVTARFSAEPDFEDRTIGFRCAADVGN
ncbi:MAG: SUMF1/EgtB/PvdO family nonheme iron enzyme [Nitrospira sp.]|jgi:formylglycine-generating enzyme required for sulfatase activity|nr:formylglycine-generating enzyme family protein [Nitrospira sp. BO4]